MGRLLVCCLLWNFLSRHWNKRFDVHYWRIGLGSYILRRKIEKTRLKREEMDGKVFISHQSRQFLLYS